MRSIIVTMIIIIMVMSVVYLSKESTHNSSLVILFQTFSEKRKYSTFNHNNTPANLKSLISITNDIIINPSSPLDLGGM